MIIENYGNDLINQDIKRLKKYKSLEKDLEVYFNYHSNLIEEQKNLSCIVDSGKTLQGDTYWICKDRIKITNPKTANSDGCRLWFMVLFKLNVTIYIRILVYQAREKNKYPTTICRKIANERLASIGVSK